MLALGSEPAMRALARRELEGVSSPAQQVETADGWFDLAEKTESGARRQLQSRAAHWYARALPGVSGLAKLKVEKRLGRLRSALDQESSASDASGSARDKRARDSRRTTRRGLLPGLVGEYFQGKDFQTRLAARIDTTVGLCENTSARCRSCVIVLPLSKTSSTKGEPWYQVSLTACSQLLPHISQRAHRQGVHHRRAVGRAGPNIVDRCRCLGRLLRRQDKRLFTWRV